MQEFATAALESADEYVWVCGEEGRFWPPQEVSNTSGVYLPWPQVLPGCDLALAFARDPRQAVINFLTANPNAINLARNADFNSGTSPNIVPHWSWWQNDTSTGNFSWDNAVGAQAPGSALMEGVADSCYIQKHDVQPGQKIIIVAKVRQVAAGYPLLVVRWQDQNGDWTEWDSDITISLPDAAPTTEWRQIAGAVVVPPGAGNW